VQQNLSKPLLIDLNSIKFSQQIVAWYHLYGRKELPWQLRTDQDRSYHVWLSEIMLQQTQVAKVIEYFDRFIQTFPRLDDLANANEQQVLALWSGLGYYNRARNLYKTAQVCQQKFNSQLPNDLQQLIDLPGIGRSTAAAIMSLAYDQPEPIMDGNVKRVFARHFLVAGEPNISRTLKQLWQLAEVHKEQREPAAYTQGLMDLGAIICTKHQPKCEQCPVKPSCQAHINDVVEQYPTKKNKVKQTEVDLFAVLTVDGQYVGLSQRDEQSIWPKLWFLPLFESVEDIISVYADAQQHFSLTHKLTHRILQIHIYLLKQPIESKTVAMIDRQDLINRPHPKALIHILNQHDNLT